VRERVVATPLSTPGATQTQNSGAIPAESNQTTTQFTARLKALQPVLAKVESVNKAAAEQARAQVAEGNKAFLAKQTDAANAALDRVLAILKQGLTPAAPAPPAGAKATEPAASGADPAAEWERRVTALEPRVLEARKTRAGEAKWMTLFTSAQDLGSEGNFAKSMVILDKLEALLNVPPKEAGSQPISNVALQKSLLAWDDARKKAHAELQVLEREILELFNDDPRLAQVKQNSRKLDPVLGEYAQELRDRLDEAYNASAEEKPKYCAGAVTVLKRYRAYLSSDPFIKAIAKNLLKPINIEGVLGKPLDEVAKLPGA
jgi:hypothetical protein